MTAYVRRGAPSALVYVDNPQLYVESSLLHAIAREVIANLRLDFLCCRDIGTTADFIALLELGKPASIERARQLRLESQRRIIIVDSRVELAHLHVGQPTRVIRRCIGRLRLKRLIAVLQRRLQFTKDGAGPTASAPRGFRTGIETNRLVIVAGRASVLVLFLVSFGAVDEGLDVVGIEPDRLIKIFDREVVFALLPVSYTAVVEGLGVIWIELDRLIEILNGVVVVPLFGIGVATIIVSDSGSRSVFAQIDDRRTTIDLKFRRGAIGAVAQRKVLEKVILGLRVLRRRW